jgi:hypothetical protein
MSSIKNTEHPMFGRIYIFIVCLFALVIGLPLFFKMQHSMWMQGLLAYGFLLILIGFVLYHLAFIYHADDADVQMWMDQYVLNEPTYLHHVIFHFVFFMSLLVLTHFVFVFYRLFSTTD